MTEKTNAEQPITLTLDTAWIGEGPQLVEASEGVRACMRCGEPKTIVGDLCYDCLDYICSAEGFDCMCSALKSAVDQMEANP